MPRTEQAASDHSFEQSLTSGLDHPPAIRSHARATHRYDSTQALIAMNSHPASLPEFRARWRSDWLDAIAEFADYDLQRRSWPGGDRYNSPSWSYVEWTCRYFNDLALDSGYRVFIDDGFVSRAEADAALAFHTALDAYEPPKKDSYDFEAILSDPAWERLVSLADAARQLLLTLITDPVERDMLTRHHD